jgi:hypothetical protein
MRESNRGRMPSPAMIVAIVALIVALGGSSYAAVQLSVNSVGTKQIRKNAVTTPKVKNGAITAAKVRNGAVTPAKIADGAVTASKLLPGSVGPGAIAEGAVGEDELGEFPAVRAVAPLVQTVSDFTATTINLSSTSFDSGGMFDAADNAIVIPRSGLYLLSGSLGWSTNGTGQRQLRIVIGGQIQISQATPGLASSGIRQNASGILRLKAGDRVKLVGFQVSGGPLDTQIAGPQMAAWLSAVWLAN